MALPPGVSIAIHAALLILLLIVGSRAATLASQDPAPKRIPLAELEFTAPPKVATPETDTQPDSDSVSRTNQTPPTQQSNTLDTQARALQKPTAVTSQAMSSATLDSLARQSSSLSTEPTQAPAPISFAGVSTGAARSIVYVVDTSGATMTSLSYIRERLLQSIDRLSPTQRFQVIAFRRLSDSTYTTPDLQQSDNKLPRATRANKQAVADWIKAMPAQGQSNPVDGLAAAIDLEPDMILLISRGIQRTEAPWAGGLKSVRQRLDQLNPLDPIQGTRPVVIKTIQLLDEDPTGIMRTIGVFHGDGHNDHQVITYNQLVSPEPERTLPANSSTDQRLSAAEDQLASLKASGALYRFTTSIPTPSDQDAIQQARSRIQSLLEKSDQDDPCTALLLAETSLLSETVDSDLASTLLETLSETVFVSPDLDARRRIIIAQLKVAQQKDQGLTDLNTLISERDQLNLDDLTVAHAILVLASHAQAPSQQSNQPPFTTDPAWAIMLAQTQSLRNLNASTEDPLAPLLNLRSIVSQLEPAIDQSITTLIDHTNTDPNTLPEIVRFIHARAKLTTPDQDLRLNAINALITLGDSTDQHLAQDALWLACLGSRALNTRESNTKLIVAASSLADRFPQSEGSPDALAGAIDAATATNSPLLTPLLRQAIALYPSRIEIDLWKLQLIKLLSAPEQQSEQNQLIASLTPATRESDLGAEIFHANALDADPADQLKHAITAANTLDTLRSPLANHWHRSAAALEIDTNPTSASIRLSRLVNNSPSSADPELELLYCRALLNDDQPEQALERLTKLSIALNDNASKHFWHTWTLIIETAINQGNAADQSSAQAHLTRLQLIDPKLGPEPFRTRLTNAQNTLHSKP